MYLADIFVCAVSLAGLPGAEPAGRPQRGAAGRRPAHRAVLRGRAPARRRGRDRARRLRRRARSADGVGDGHRPGGARAAPHAHQDVLRLPHDLRRSAEHQRLPDLPRAAGRAARAQRGGHPAGDARRDRARLHRARDQRLRPEELLLPRSAQGLSDLAVRPTARDRGARGLRLARSRADRGRASRGCTSRRTRASWCTTGSPGRPPST